MSHVYFIPTLTILEERHVESLFHEHTQINSGLHLPGVFRVMTPVADSRREFPMASMQARANLSENRPKTGPVGDLRNP